MVPWAGQRLGAVTIQTPRTSARRETLRSQGAQTWFVNRSVFINDRIQSERQEATAPGGQFPSELSDCLQTAPRVVRLSRPDITNSRTSPGSCLTCQNRTSSPGAPDASTALSA